MTQQDRDAATKAARIGRLMERLEAELRGAERPLAAQRARDARLWVTSSPAVAGRLWDLVRDAA